MTDESAASADPGELLAAVQTLTRQVRIIQRRTWLPLLAFALIMLAAIPVYWYAPPNLGPCRSGPGGTTVCTALIPWLVLAYWMVMLVLAYAVVAACYLRQSRRRGVGTRIRRYVVSGIVLTVLLGGVSLWRALDPLLPSSGTHIFGAPALDSGFGLATPAAVIGLALLVLARVERSWALLAYSLVYLLIVLVQAGRVIHSSSPWYFLPQLLLPAAVLLLGSAAFALMRPAAGRTPR